MKLDFESEVWDRYLRPFDVAIAIHDNSHFTLYGVSFLAKSPQ